MLDALFYRMSKFIDNDNNQRNGISPLPDNAVRWPRSRKFKAQGKGHCMPLTRRLNHVRLARSQCSSTSVCSCSFIFRIKFDRDFGRLFEIVFGFVGNTSDSDGLSDKLLC